MHLTSSTADSTGSTGSTGTVSAVPSQSDIASALQALTGGTVTPATASGTTPVINNPAVNPTPYSTGLLLPDSTQSAAQPPSAASNNIIVSAPQTTVPTSKATAKKASTNVGFATASVKTPVKAAVKPVAKKK
jgi:hypothetical protein